MMNAHEETKERIMEAVWNAENQRMRPIDLEKKLEHEHGLTLWWIKDAVNELVDEGQLVYTYRDPCSYVEIPIEEGHHAARPMKVIPDKRGEYWICDNDADPTGDLAKEGCWRCGDLAFTPSD
jgi:hypothetical protein